MKEFTLMIIQRLEKEGGIQKTIEENSTIGKGQG